MKTCTKCGAILPLSEYYKDHNQKSGLRPECKTCNKKQCTKWAKANKEKHRGYNIKHHYGISVEVYDSLLTKQNGTCAICFQPPGKRRLAIDHCHTTGTVRGLLCARCNQGIGHFRDNVKYLTAAITYLESTQ